MSTADLQDEGLLEFLYRAPVGLLQLACDGAIEMCNPLTAQLLMPLSANGELDNLFDILSPHAPALRQVVADFPHRTGVIHQAERFVVPTQGKRGHPRMLSLYLTKLDSDRLMAVVSDVTHESDREQLELHHQLHRAARVDVLTTLPNRMAMRELIDGTLAIAPATHGAVLIVGAERLQELAESFGAVVRDEVLHVMAMRLKAALRPSDCVGCAGEADRIAAKGGSDEFVVLLQRMSDPADAQRVALRVLETLGTSYRIGALPLDVRLSVGVVTLDAEYGDAEAVLRDGAIALSEAKRAGGARSISFVPDMRSRAIHRGRIEVELRQALERRELFVVYQPVVPLHPDLADGAGVEALVRWRHPTRGVVPPDEFIGVAEETGLIVELGRQVLETACRDFVRWRDRLGSRAPSLLAVNLSRAQLKDPGLLDKVRSIVDESGIAIGCLQLEVTESLAAQDDGVQAQLHALRDLGLKLALDDFGTGYSSLSSLHLLPVDTVKIDRSFVTLLETSPHHRVLIEATIKVSKSLGMTTVAEGIETSVQADFVRRLGCDKAQGYLFSRPVAEPDVLPWFLAGPTALRDT